MIAKHFGQGLRGLALIAASGFVLALVAILMTRFSGGLALLWIADGPLIALLCYRRRGRWTGPLIAYAIGLSAAALIASPLRAGTPALVALDLADVLIAAILLQRFNIARTMFDTGRGVTLFVLIAGLVSPATTAVAAGAILGTLFGGSYWLFASNWVLAHGLGNLLTTPLVMLVFLRRWSAARRRWQRSEILPAAATGAGLVAATLLVFSQDRYPLLFAPILPLIVVTFRYHQLGAVLGMVTIGLIGGICTLLGSGPVMLVEAGDAARLQFFDFYLVAIFLVALPLAAVLAHRDALLRRLEKSEARYRSVADNATDIMLTLDPDGMIRFASPSVRELGFFEPEDLIDRKGTDLVHAEDRAIAQEAHRALLQSPEDTLKAEFRIVRADGSLRWFESNSRVVCDAQGNPSSIVVVMRDLNDRKHRENELLRAASTDALTGLPNRAAFRRAAKTAMALANRGTPSTLALLDIDYFKQVNDQHGHAAGDAALEMIAELLRESLRPSDAVARIGGEEFALVFHGLALGEARTACERLCNRLAARPLVLNEARIRLTMSAGLAEFCPGYGLDLVFGAADRALYGAKGAGRNRVAVASDPLAA